MTNPLVQLAEKDQSIWMDNLSRSILKSGELAQLIDTWALKGITSNPAIFQKAIEGNKDYDDGIHAARDRGLDVNGIYESLVFEDITDAADIFDPIYRDTDGKDGYISIEVSPKLAYDTDGTVSEGVRFFKTLERDNIMIKVPGTDEGLAAVTALIGQGVNVNVTLLFSVDNYVRTAEAYIDGLEQLDAAGGDVSKVASVASFFLSRIDSKVDVKLDALIQASSDAEEIDRLTSLLGKTAIANAKLAYEEYGRIYNSDRFKALAAKGAKPQRLLWASTSTKNPNYDDTLYVKELIGPETVNTVPPNTLAAFLDHGVVADTLVADWDDAHTVIAELERAGIDLDAVMAELQSEGVDKFITPFEQLFAALEAKVNQLALV